MQIIKPRILTQLALCMLGGVLFFFTKNVVIPVVVILLISYVLFDIVKIRFWKEFAVRLFLCLMFFCTGIVACLFEEKSFAEACSQVGEPGTIVSKEIKNEKLQLTVKLGNTQYKIYVYTDEKENLDIGDVIKVDGELKFFSDPRNEGSFEEKKYYRSKFIIGSIFPKNITSVRKATSNVGEKIFTVKKNMSEVYKACMGDDEATIIAAIVMGEKSNTSARIKEVFKNAGISHVLSISGMHISLIAAALMWALKWCRINNKIKIVIAVAVLVSYGIFCGMSVSTVRALVMFILATVGNEMRRNYDRLTALSILMIFTIGTSPYMIYNSGFVFSYLVTLFLIIISELKIKNKILSAITLQLFSVPIVAYVYYEIPTLSFAVNMALIPYMGTVMVMGLLGGIAGLFFLPLAKIILLPVGMILKVYIFLCMKIDELPFSSLVTGGPKAGQIVTYYLLLVLLLHILICLKNTVRSNIKKIGTIIITSGVGVAALMLIIMVKPIHGLEIDFLDVGQGDGIFVSSEKTSFFIDGGSTDVKDVGKYRIQPFLRYKGVKKIDYWVISHADFDHLSGALEVIKSDSPPKNIVISKYISQSDNLENLLKEASNANINVIYVVPGDEILCKNFKCSFLWPMGENDGDANSNSLVCLVEGKEGKCLFTGDISAKEESVIADMYGKKLDAITVYKAAHHGSKYSNGEALLSIIKPRVSVISCGANNRYGHPGKEAVNNMKLWGNSVFRTDLMGQVKCIFRNNKIAVSVRFE